MPKKWKPQAPLFEQVNFMKCKLKLMDGDRKAYYDATYQKLNLEHEKVVNLRAQVKELRQEIKNKLNPDEFITDQALQKQPIDRQAMNKFSSSKAIDMMDGLVCDKMKKLNAMKYLTIVKKDRYHELEEQYTQMLIFASEYEEIKRRQGKMGQNIRDLENRLDKSYLKKNEADHVNATYKKIKDLLKTEAVTYELTLTAMETEVSKAEDELQQVMELNNDAVLSRNHDLVELRRHEEFIATEMKRRELELTNMKKLSNSRTLQAVQSKVIGPVDISFGENDEASNKGDDNSIVINENYDRLKKQEELFFIIKEATGISNLNQMVKRFQAQVNTSQSLLTVKLKLENELETKQIEKGKLMSDLMSLKYTSEDKNTRHTNSKQDRETKIENLKKSLNQSAINLAKEEYLLARIRFLLEHLAIKCEKKVDRNGDLTDLKFYTRLLDKITNELVMYIGEMKDYNIQDELHKFKEQEDEIILVPTDLNMMNEQKVNSFNTRVKITTYQTKEPITNDDDSETDDKLDVLTRDGLKKQSRKIWEAKAKKKVSMS